MAHARLIALAFVSALALACGGDRPAEAPQPLDTTPKGAADFPNDDRVHGKFHSTRFALTVPLPDGRAWKIDDHSRPELVATHEKTSSTLTVLTTLENSLVNRQACEKRARDLNWVPKTLTTVEDETTVGPEAYDSRIWVALEAKDEKAAVQGHVFVFGAFIRKCLLIHATTRVPSAKDETVLASRLALLRAKIVGGLTFDPPRTTDDAVPRDKPEIRK